MCKRVLADQQQRGQERSNDHHNLVLQWPKGSFVGQLAANTYRSKLWLLRGRAEIVSS